MITGKLRQRRLQAEEMDRPDIAEPDFAGSLCALERINWWSGSARILWPPIRALAREVAPRPLQVLDVATGAGDIPLRLRRRAQCSQVSLEIHGCDRSPHAVRFAQHRAEAAGAAVHFFQLDALADPFPGAYDVICCSLFLHHLDELQVVALLRRMGQAARHLVLVNDLARSTLGFLLAWTGVRVLSRSPIAHTDGPRSVEGAFTPSEALALAHRAGLEGAAVSRRWPCRYLLTWKNPMSTTDS